MLTGIVANKIVYTHTTTPFSTFVRLLKLTHPLPLTNPGKQPSIHNRLLEKLTDQALALLRQILQLILHVITITRISMHTVRVTLNILSSRTSRTSRTALPTTLATWAALNEVVDITTAPSTLSTAHEWPTVSPADTHEPRLPAFPACLRISCVKHAPDLGSSGSIDEHEVAVAGAVGWTVVAAGLKKRTVRFAP